MTPERSLLFVPGEDRNAIETAQDSDADTVIIDLEDTVGPSNKSVARETVVETLPAWPDAGPNLDVRINGANTPYGIADLKSIIEADAWPDAVVLPAIRSRTDVRIFSDILDDDDDGSSIGIVPIIEHPRAVFNAYQIATATPRIEALAFGSVDFQLNTGLSILNPETDVRLPRYVISMAASTVGVNAFDTVFLDRMDTEGLRAETAEAESMGYDGKLAIDPDQVNVINNVFTPTSDEVDRARRLINEFEATETGTISFEGKFIDKPVIDQQRALLDQARE